jgi:predicted porin
MTKKLLPTVIGMILAGGVAVAQADVQIMGHIDESVNYIDGSNSPYVSRGDNDTQFICTTCSVGVKGSEDLGNGLKALFFLDWQYDINNSTGLTGRDQYLGMGGNFGTLKVGTQSTVYKSHGAMLDPIYRTVAQGRDIGLQSGLHTGKGPNGQGRATNTVRYDSPSWNGLKLGATYTLTPDNTTYDDNGYGAGISYENGGILVFGDYLTNDSGGDDEAYKLGAKYTLNNFAIFGQYEFDKGLITDRSTDTLGQNNTGDGADVWFAGATYTMGNNMLYAAYGQGDNAKTTGKTSSTSLACTNDPVTNIVTCSNVTTSSTGNVSTDQYDSMELVGVHNFSKRTLAYLGFVYIDPDNSSNITHYTLGVKHTF